MKRQLEQLLRSNFRCGRMLDSRTGARAGRFAVRMCRR